MSVVIDPELETRIRSLPDSPGIYIFRDAERTPLYVGKAKSLRKRVPNYLTVLEPRLQVMLLEARELDYVVTDSEAEALLLENNWIKRRQPRYNIRLRDDKTYPYLRLTLHEDYPRLAFTRRVTGDADQFFGPYLPAGLARRAIKLVQKLFQVRVCRIEIDGSLPRPCLYYDMRRCLGPCVDGLTSRREYAEAVEAARLFLAGRNDQLLVDLRRQMRESADRLEFERAAQLRDAIAEVESISQRRKLSSQHGEDVDIFGVCVRGENAAVVVLVMRGGQVLDRRELFWEGEEVSPRRLLSELLPQLYDRTTFIPKEIHLPLPVEGDDALVEWLGERKGERVYLRLPSRGPKAERVQLAMRNAAMAYRRRFRGADAAAEGLERLRVELDLTDPPSRIEGFDISTFQGGETVASLVVWEGSGMVKGEYRSFNIRGLDGTDDFAAIRQAVERRYRRRLEEVGEMPDLILIDGGRGQLNAALDALSLLGVEETPTVALAKQQEEIYVPQLPAPLRLERRDPGLKILQQIRDEAHRFAVDRHRRRRRGRTLRSRFDELLGVGPKRRKLLVRRFGSYRGLEQASLDDVCEVLGPTLGRSVFEQVHGDPPSQPEAGVPAPLPEAGEAAQAEGDGEPGERPLR